MTLSEYSNSKYIISAFDRNNIKISKEQADNTITYIEELLKWNRIITLISESDKDHLINRHIVNSIALFQRIDNDKYSSIADIGSGNGFPGIMLAIYYPQRQFTLIEHRGKKASFLKQTVQACRLNNVHVYARNAKTFDFASTELILARAFGDICTIIDMITGIFSGHIAIYRRNDIVLYNSSGNICST